MNRFDVTELLLLAALWGASFILIRYAVPDFGPFALILVRVGLATLFLVPILAVRRQVNALRENWFHACTVGYSVPPFLFYFLPMPWSACQAVLLRYLTQGHPSGERSLRTSGWEKQ